LTKKTCLQPLRRPRRPRKRRNSGQKSSRRATDKSKRRGNKRRDEDYDYSSDSDSVSQEEEEEEEEEEEVMEIAKDLGKVKTTLPWQSPLKAPPKVPFQRKKDSAQVPACPFITTAVGPRRTMNQSSATTTQNQAETPDPPLESLQQPLVVAVSAPQYRETGAKTGPRVSVEVSLPLHVPRGASISSSQDADTDEVEGGLSIKPKAVGQPSSDREGCSDFAPSEPSLSSPRRALHFDERDGMETSGKSDTSGSETNLNLRFVTSSQVGQGLFSCYDRSDEEQGYDSNENADEINQMKMIGIQV
jgi:hypothetical protein